MGKILIIRDADFSNNAAAIKVSSIPLTRVDDLIAFYSSGGVELNGDGDIESIFSPFVPRTPVIRSVSSDKAFVTTSSLLKGTIIRFASSTASSYEGYVPINLDKGVSFSAIFRRPTPSISTGGNACLFSIQEIGLQFRLRAATGQPHLLLHKNGVSEQFMLNYDTPIGEDRITLTLNKSQMIFYLNGLLMNSFDISTFNLIDTAQNFSLGANWNQANPTGGISLSQFYVHDKDLSLVEVQELHSNLASLLT